MKTDRRGFVRTGVNAGLAAAAAVSGSGAAAQGGFSIAMQFYGLMVHGSWKSSTTNDPGRWEVLSVRQAHHRPQLLILADDVVSHMAGTPYRLDPRFLWWPLLNTDVEVSIDTIAGGDVTPITGKRPANKACPYGLADEVFTDITWLPDLTNLLKTRDNTARLLPKLKGPVSGLLNTDPAVSRVRLTTGSIGCARPTSEEFENLIRLYTQQPYPQFVPQYYTDLVRFTGMARTSLSLTLTKFGGAAYDTIAITPKTPSTSTFIKVENIDPGVDTHGASDFCKEHFRPYYTLYNMTIPEDQRPCPDDKKCCVGSCDPPYYCVPARGEF